jgi:hypothetical protein
VEQTAKALRHGRRSAERMRISPRRRDSRQPPAHIHSGLPGG